MENDIYLEHWGSKISEPWLFVKTACASWQPVCSQLTQAGLLFIWGIWRGCRTLWGSLDHNLVTPWGYPMHICALFLCRVTAENDFLHTLLGKVIASKGDSGGQGKVPTDTMDWACFRNLWFFSKHIRILTPGKFSLPSRPLVRLGTCDMYF